MSKAVMLSIRPEWCAKICSGVKTVEIRKTRPKLKTPFKCYIYKTLPKSGDWNDTDGRIIGEFVCDCITPLYNVCMDDWKRLAGGLHRIEKELVSQACLTEAQLHTYAGGKNCFAWHISDLEIYDRPKELSEFKGPCKIEADCCACPYYNYTKMDCDGRKIKRPPQSWCYVEVTEDV